MQDNLKILRDLGAHKIHSDTHISREFVQALIHESFEDLQSVQFFGFVSIIERTYGLDLTELSDKGRAYFKERDAKFTEDKKVFVVAKKKKNNTFLSFSIIIIILLSFLYYSFVYVNSLEETTVVIDNSKIEDAQKNLDIIPQKELTLVVDENKSNNILLSQEINTTKELAEVQTPVKLEEVKVVRSLKILPKHKIWAGYINIATNQKYQKVFKKEFAIDTSKDWLLLFGKGKAKLEINGEVKKFSSKQNMRFKYVNGKFEKITITEFKILNKGRKW